VAKQAKTRLRQVEQVPRYKLAARQIADLIECGELRPGSKMPTDRELVDRLGVSRATIREAIIALEISGFVENRFGAGAFVSHNLPESSALSKVSGPGPFELLEARMLVEGEIAFLASQSITDEQLSRMEECNRKMRWEEGDRLRIGSADEQFHRILAQATQNTALINMVAQFWSERTKLPMWVQLHREVGDMGELREQLVAQHELVVLALHERHAEKSKQAMRSHIASVGRLLLDSWNTLEHNQKEDITPPSEQLVKQLR